MGRLGIGLVIAGLGKIKGEEQMRAEGREVMGCMEEGVKLYGGF